MYCNLCYKNDDLLIFLLGTNIVFYSRLNKYEISYILQ